MSNILYDQIGVGYTRHRRPDARIGTHISRALGRSGSVLNAIGKTLGPIDVRDIPIHADCTDGFLGAYWRRPAAYLNDGVRRAISAFDKVSDTMPGLERLERDLASGTWERSYGELLTLSELDIGYRLVVHER